MKILRSILVPVLLLSGCYGQGTEDGAQFVRTSGQQALGQGQEVDALEPTFENVKAKLIDPYCLRCHKTWVDEHSIRNFIVPGRADESSFYQSIVDQMMPPPRARARGVPSADDVALLKAYIDRM
ncbi:MAG: hypothetical protein JNL01_12465 [Bdellovibrionales bacterium]|nr:hypothetical protein [Bdellovibrionales bacterium]